MQGYDDQPSMEDVLGRLDSMSGRAKHKAWQGIQKLSAASVYVMLSEIVGLVGELFLLAKGNRLQRRS